MAATRLPEGTSFRVVYNQFRNRFDAMGDAGKVVASVPCDGRITACRPARVWLAETLAREATSDAHGHRVLRLDPGDPERGRRP